MRLLLTPQVREDDSDAAIYTASWMPSGVEHGMCLSVGVAPYEQDEHGVTMFFFEVKRAKKGTGFRCVDDWGSEPLSPDFIVLSGNEAMLHPDIEDVFH